VLLLILFGCTLIVMTLPPQLTQAAPPPVPLPPATRPATPATYAAMADEVERHLHRHLLELWFPRCIDKENGGFHMTWGRDWSRTPSQGKGAVVQARMTWIAARVAIKRPALREQYLPYVAHGLDFLERVMWDAERGGFYWLLDDAGKPTSDVKDNKHLYGISFGLYAAAAAFEATSDERAKDLAVRAFEWVEKRAHDDRHGGYHEYFTRDGAVIGAAAELGATGAGTPIGGRAGYKSMNTHIHLLEAYTQLYEVWPDPRLKTRLAELLVIVRDKIAVEPGVLNLWFTPDWRATADHDSFGHDIETAYLLHEAAHALGQAGDPRTLRVERMLVDHTLALGFDPVRGGVYNKGTAFDPPYDLAKDWWGQFEALNALLMMHERHGRETDVYWRGFGLQWRNITEEFTDKQHGGIYGGIDEHGKPTDASKGHNWKAAYHDGRALLEVADRLRRMADPAGGGPDAKDAGPH
jgi:mannobiose 2-epimerase